MNNSSKLKPGDLIELQLMYSHVFHGIEPADIIMFIGFKESTVRGSSAIVLHKGRVITERIYNLPQETSEDRMLQLFKILETNNV